ncbi:prenyltransferase [archaeon]|nr:MAG: prenyltransferase [archaeon]
MKEAIAELFVATRPWSFTTTVIPVLVTAAVTGVSFFTPEFARALAMGLFVHAGANLTNTYFDFINGFDTKQHNSDPTLVDKRLSPVTILLMSIVCYTIGIFSILPLLFSRSYHDIIIPFVSGLVLAFFYTGNPVGLKYIALGDITIFLCFGPLLMQVSAIIMTQKMSYEMYIYTIPIGLLTESILHANNARDIKNDTANGAITLASIMGLTMSYNFFIFLIVGAYLSVLGIAAYFHYGCLLSLLTLPLGLDLIKKFRDQQLKDLSKEVSKLHLPFGVLMLVGILTTSTGFLV